MPCSPRAGREARLPLTSGALQVKCTQQTFYEQGAESLTNKQQREVDIDTATPALKMKQQEAVAAIKPEEGRGSRVMELEVVFYAPGDKMGSPSRQHWLAVEIGVYGQEGKFETVKARGLIPTLQTEGSFFGKVYSDAMAFDIEHPVWQKAVAGMTAAQMSSAFGARPHVDSVTKLHPFGPSERRQGTNALLVSVFCPPGREQSLPERITRVLHLPTGAFAHESWQEEGGGKVILTSPVLVRWYLPGSSEKAFIYPEPKQPPREANAAAHWRRDFKRLKVRALQRNARMRNPKPRSSPRLSESAKRRRTEAVRGGGGVGPGAAALQALGLDDDADEAAANAAAAAQVDAEMQVDDGAGVGLDDSVENL